MNGHDPNSHDLSTNAASTRARDLFDRASARLDIATANRLRLIRRDAQADASAHGRTRMLMPAATVAATVLAVGLVWWLPRDNTPAHIAPVAIEAAQDAYIADEDAEVYTWLAEAPVATSNAKAGAL